MKKRSLYERSTIILLFFVWIWEYVANIWYTAKYFLIFDMNSDYAGDAVLAKHLADSGNYLFSSDWYPTTELYVIHHQIIMTPLFKIFKDYNTTWIATSVVAFFLLSASICFFMKILGSSTIRSMLAVVLFVNPIMKFQMSFSVWFHGYLFYYLIAFVLTGMLIKLYSDNSRPSPKDIAAVCILSLLAGLCGIRMFMIVFIPLVLTVIFDLYNKELKCLLSIPVRLIAGACCAAMVGFVVYSLYLVPRYGNGSLLGIGVSLNGAEKVNRNILSIPQTLIDGLNVDFSGTSSIYYAIVVFVELLLWIVIFANNISLIIKKNTDKRIRFLAIFAAICGALNIVFMVLTQSNEEMLYRYRYFSLSTFVQIPLFALTVKCEQPVRVKDFCRFAVIAASAMAIPVWQIDAVKQYGWEVSSWRQPYIDYLEENGYKFGVSTYWNADTTILASNGKVQVAPVNNDSDFTFFEWNTQRSYRDRMPEFVLLTVDEYMERNDNSSEDNVLYRDDSVVITTYPQ